MANKGTADLLRIFDKDASGTFDEATDSLEAIRDALDLSDTDIEAVLADTNEIQSDLADGGRLDLLVDAIKAKTDNLPVDPADESSLETAITTAESNIRGADSDTLKSLSDQIDGVGGGGASAADVADAVWDEATSGHTDAGSFGKALQDLSGGGGIDTGLAYKGTCDVGMSGSTTTIVCDDLAGYGDDVFNDKYWMKVIKNANSVGNAPEGDTARQVTDYVSASGTFTVDAFTANVEENDIILLLHESLPFPKSVEYTSGSGNWTVPTGVEFVDVLIVGGGGGGSQDSSGGKGGGGGGGETVTLRGFKVTPGDSIAYVVGSGGAGTGNAYPDDGSLSSFGNIIAHPGKGANGDNTGGTGGEDGTTGGAGDSGTGPSNGSVVGAYMLSRYGGGGGGREDDVAGADGISPGGSAGTGTSTGGGGGGSYGLGADGGSDDVGDTAAANSGGGGGGAGGYEGGGDGGSGYVLLHWR